MKQFASFLLALAVLVTLLPITPKADLDSWNNGTNALVRIGILKLSGQTNEIGDNGSAITYNGVPLLTNAAASDNWTASGTTNSTLTGNAYANNVQSTNGFTSVGSGNATLSSSSGPVLIAPASSVTTNQGAFYTTTTNIAPEIVASTALTLGALRKTAWPLLIVGGQNNACTVNTNTRYMGLIGGSAQSTTEASVSCIIGPEVYLATNLCLRVNNTLGSGTNLTFTLLTNGVATGLNVSILGSGAAKTATNTTGSATIPAWGTVSVSVVGDNVTTAAPFVTWALQLMAQ